MQLPSVLEKLFNSPTVQAAAAEIKQQEAAERESLTADHATAIQSAVEVSAKFGPKLTAAAEKTAKAKQAHDDAKAAEENLRREYNSAKYAADHQADAIKWRLVKLLPESVAEVVERLNAEIERLRQEPVASDDAGIIPLSQEQRAAAAAEHRQHYSRLRALMELRTECGSEVLAVLPVEQLHAVLDRVEVTLRNVESMELMTV